MYSEHLLLQYYISELITEIRRKMNSGIYCIENIVNGKKYIGRGIIVKKRMLGTHKNCTALYNAIKKYGKNNFKRYVLIYCEEWELNRLEIECIKIFHSHVSEYGYNISYGGNCTFFNLTHSEESKIKIGNGNRGKYVSEETKKKMSLFAMTRTGTKNPNFGNHYSENTRKKISKNHADTSGENNANSKLNTQDVLKILDLYYNYNISKKEIFNIFSNCSKGHIYKILRGDAWKNTYMEGG